MKSIKEQAKELSMDLWLNKSTISEIYEDGANYVVGIVSDIINKPENDYLIIQELKETILKLKRDN